MIGVEGEFLFSFSLVDYTNIVFTDDLIAFTVIETCGSPVLPYFELSFTLKNKENLEYFNDSSIISVQMGKNSNDLKDLQFAVKKVMLSPSQDSVATVILRGIYNNQSYLVNTISQDYDKTSYEVMSDIAKRNGFNFKTNINGTNDKMIWQQASEPDFKFLHNVWKHSYIDDNSCTLIGIDLDNNFIFKNIPADIANNNIAYTFTTASTVDDEVQVHSDFKTVNNSTVTNAFGGYIKERYVYNVGKRKHFVEYFGDAFEGTVLWEKQLKNESLKARISTDTNVGPGYLHYNAEADLDDANKDSFFTFVSVKSDDKVTNAVLDGVVTAYSAQHPVSTVTLNDLSLETIAQFVEFKHFETLYTGNILRREVGDITPAGVAFPEVLQPNVEKYKAEVRKAMAK